MKKGFRKPRKIRPIEKNLPKGYDSNWEYELHQEVINSGHIMQTKFPYTVSIHMSRTSQELLMTSNIY